MDQGNLPYSRQKRSKYSAVRAKGTTSEHKMVLKRIEAGKN